MLHKGLVIKLGDNIDTDIIIPTEYMTLETIEQMVPYSFSPLRPEIPKLIKKGDLLVCGKNFGCGSSREQAPEILKALGVFCIVAKSFARIFYRNALNNGLLVIENSEIYDKINEGDSLTIDLKNHWLVPPDGEKISFGKIPERLLNMLEEGGLINFYKRRNKESI